MKAGLVEAKFKLGLLLDAGFLWGVCKNLHWSRLRRFQTCKPRLVHITSYDVYGPIFGDQNVHVCEWSGVPPCMQPCQAYFGDYSIRYRLDRPDLYHFLNPVVPRCKFWGFRVEALYFFKTLYFKTGHFSFMLNPKKYDFGPEQKTSEKTINLFLGLSPIHKN